MKNPQRPIRRDISDDHDNFVPIAPKNKFLAEIKKNIFLIMLIIGGIGYLWWDHLPKPMPMPTISAGLNMKFMGRASRYNVNLGINDALDRSVNLADYYGRPKIIAYYRSECMECWPTLRSLDLLNMKMQSSVDIIPIALTAFGQNQANQISRNYRMQGIKSLKIYNRPVAKAPDSQWVNPVIQCWKGAGGPSDGRVYSKESGSQGIISFSDGGWGARFCADGQEIAACVDTRC